jgi:transcriptional regulator with XRE-family HTH domain
MSRKKSTKLKKISPLGLRLHKIMKDYNIKAVDFAKKVECSQAYITQLIYGKKINPSKGFFLKIEAAFNVNHAWITQGTGNIYADTVSYSLPLHDTQVLYMDKNRRAQLLQMVSEILDTPGKYSRALVANIEAFHYGITEEANKDNKFKNLENRIDMLEKKT